MIASCHLPRRLLLHLIELGGAYESLVLVHEMRVDVAFIFIGFVYNSHVTRNFAFDALIRLSLHLSFLFYFLSSFLHIVD